MHRIAQRTQLLAAAALGLLILHPGMAWAHAGAGPAAGLLHGFAHPVLGADHVLAMVAVGVWAAQRGGRSLWLLPAAFIAMMAVGGLLGVAGVGLPGVEAGILASVLVLGALIAAAARPSALVGLALVAGFALVHGHAHGAEMPATVSGFGYGLGFGLATALLHATGVLFTLVIERRAQARSPRWVRLAGAAIGIAGLALWLV